MPEFTLDDIKQVIDQRFIQERETTRQMVREEVAREVAREVGDQFQSFIETTFNPALERIDDRFERLEDRVDRLTMDASELRLDMRHVKHVLRSRDVAAATE